MTSIATPAQSGPMLAETFAPILHVLTFDTIDDPRGPVLAQGAEFSP